MLLSSASSSSESMPVSISKNGIRIRPTTTKKLAEFLDVPYYYILPYFENMEQETRVTPLECVGVMTTRSGTARYSL